MKVCTAIAPVNIAVIKYWGKRDTDLILPTNSSLSVTLDAADLFTKTTAAASSHFNEDKFWLNGKEVSIEKNNRLRNCIERLRQLRREHELKTGAGPRISDCKLHIASENSFPTAAGLASSASGLACLVFVLAKLYELPLTLSELSVYARMGSGSASRSVFGGYVKWEMGVDADGTDSIAVQVAPRSHWPEMRALILVIGENKKDVSSTSGMQQTVMTSSLFKYRVENVVPSRMQEMESAISKRDFQSFASITMQDSNQFHAVCADTFPPIFYLNDTSRSVIGFVTALNNAMQQYVVAYTFDAGPNAVLYFLQEKEDLIIACFNHFLGDEVCPLRGDLSKLPDVVDQVLQKFVASPIGKIKRTIITGVGEGPSVVENEMESLLDSSGRLILATDGAVQF